MRSSVVLLLFAALSVHAEEKAESQKPLLPAKWLEAMPWRSLGPANMGGRITALAVYEKDKNIWYAATASGGLLKTVNNGVTFEHQFDKESTVSIGDVAVCQSDPNLVWIGTGECNPRNSVSWGDGVYKSTDGGKTWQHMGLKETRHVSTVLIHPQKPDIVYVGAVGRTWGTNEERGLFKTTDGGKTWSKVLFVDDKTGVIDVQMHPSEPDTLLVTTWERQRDGFDTNDPAKKWGPGSALWKTTDGAKTFKKVTSGLPAAALGRMGLHYYRKNPDIVFLVLESERIGKEPENAPYLGIVGRDADAGAKLTQIVKKGPAEQAGLKANDIVLAVDGETVHSYADLIRLARKHEAGDTVKLEVSRQRKSVVVELKLGPRPKPKKDQPERRSPFAAGLGGQRANFQDQQGKEGHEYGGLYKSTDGGETWARVNSVNPRPMYFSEVRVDPSDANRVWVLGIRLWKSEDGGAKMTPDGHGRGVHVDHHALWIDPDDGRHMILGTDGGIYVTYDRGKNWDHLNHVAIGQFYHVGIGPRRDYRVYGGLQDNGSWGGPSRVRHAAGPTNHDWVRIGGGDGFRCLVDRNDPDQIYFESQNGGVGRRHMRSGERAMMRPRPKKGSKEKYRFNWHTPFILSHFNSRIYYVGGNRVFRSLDKGNGLRAISPNITATERGSATALVESPLDANLLYVGTDDGALFATRDGGHNWIDLWTKAEPKPPVAEAKKQPPAVDPAPVVPAKDERTRTRAERMKERLMRMDRDGDGNIARSEVPERAGRMFDRLDANKDGVIVPAEIEAAAQRMEAPEPAKKDAAPAPAAPPGSDLSKLMPGRRWVSWIEPSRFKRERAYLVFDAHRSDDLTPYVFVTEDSGATWRSLRANLPDSAGTTRVLCEDLNNENLLYLGTEFGAWVSIDRGESWTSLNSNLPTVAVHAFAIHPTAGEIVAATHGRSLWAMDVTTLRQMTKETLEADAHLYRPNTAVLWRPQPGRGASRTFVGQNPPFGAVIHYTLKKKTDDVTLKITDPAGKKVRDLEAKGEAGLNRVVWDLRGPPPEGPRSRWRRGRRVQPGSFRVVLEAAGKTLAQELEVEIDPDHTDDRWIVHEEHAEDLEAERMLNKSKRRYPWEHADKDND